MRSVVQLVAVVLCIAIMAGFMYGLRTFMFSMGPDFAIGMLVGVASLFFLQWALWKTTGEVVFEPRRPDETLR